MRSSIFSRSLLTASVALAFSGAARAQTTQVPELNSRPDAPYTLYLNFGGFDYNVAWANRQPGVTPRYDVDGNTASFSTGEIANIREIWARTAEKYSVFGVNVTTVDPAIAAGAAGSDTARRQYYDRTARLHHTVIGGNGSWYPGAGGVSYVSTTQFANTFEGAHTNWAFSSLFGGGTNLRAIAEVTAHECGHGLGCSHQHDETNRARTYSSNGGSPLYAPIMGNSYGSQRGLWRYGATGTGTAYQNDVARIVANSGLGSFVDSGIGHTRETATALPLLGSSVDFTLASGLITPSSSANPQPLGRENYTEDYFSFETGGGEITLASNDGSQFLTPGVADPGATLDSELEILDLLGNVVGMGIASTDTLRDTFVGTLPAGRYYARISSIGGYDSGYEANGHYYTMGSYFLTGSGFTAVPEPATLAAVGLGLAMLARRRKRA